MLEADPTAPKRPVSSARSSDGAATQAQPAPPPHERSQAPARELDPEAAGDHLDRLYRTAWAICGSPLEAEDLVQETYARVLSRRRLLRGENDLGYLMRALRNTYVSSLRARSARPRTVPLPEGFEPVAGGNGASPEDARQAAEVLDAVAALPLEQRQVVAAVDLLGLRYGEAARALRLRQGTVKSRLFRARSVIAGKLTGPPDHSPREQNRASVRRFG